MNTPFRMPPRLTAPDGTQRRVGVELEFADLDAPTAAALVRELYGGTLAVESAHRCMVRGTRLGDFSVALDMRSAHPDRTEEGAGDRPPEPGKRDQLLERLRSLWGNIGSLVMPFEIAAPPIPMDRLHELDALVAALRDRGAVGTQASPFFAFGLHFNPQAASLDGDYLLDHFKAFLILAPWLRREIQVDPTRRLSGFIAAFPADYAAKLVDPAHRPGTEQLIADYIEANPTRNRELDLFPLFAHIAPDIFFAKIKDPHVRPRPAFHYRLPNARIGDPGWSLAQDWNRWVAVEELAADRARLDRLGAAYADAARQRALDGWPDEIERELTQLQTDG